MPIIGTPNLTHLIVHFEDTDSCTHFLAHISADLLRYLELEILRHGENLKDISNREEFCMMVETFVQILCAIIGPDAEGRVKFPSLSNSQVHLSRTPNIKEMVVNETVEEAMSEYLKRVPVLEDSIRDTLERRSETGAICLVLKDSIQVAHKVERHCDCYDCHFELMRSS